MQNDFYYEGGVTKGLHCIKTAKLLRRSYNHARKRNGWPGDKDGVFDERIHCRSEVPHPDALFESLDTNKSGDISKEELRKGLQTVKAVVGQTDDSDIGMPADGDIRYAGSHFASDCLIKVHKIKHEASGQNVADYRPSVEQVVAMLESVAIDLF